MAGIYWSSRDIFTEKESVVVCSRSNDEGQFEKLTQCIEYIVEDSVPRPEGAEWVI